MALGKQLVSRGNPAKKPGSKIFYLRVFTGFFVFYSFLSYLKLNGLTGDEPQYAIDGYNMLVNGSRNMPDIFNNKSVIDSFYPSGGLPPHLLAGMDVTFHSVGTSIFTIPAVLFPEPVVAVRLLFCLYSALAVTLLARYTLRKVAGHRIIVLLLTCIVFAAPPFSIFSDQIYPEIPAVLLIAVVLNLIDSNLRFKYIMASAVLGVLPWIHLRFGIVTLIGIVCLVVSGMQKFQIYIATLILSLDGFLYLVMNKAWYLTWNPLFLSEYSYQAFLPYSESDLTYRVAFGHLFSGSYGLFSWNPALLLLSAFALSIVFYRNPGFTVRASRSLVIGGCCIYLVIIASNGASGGLAFPARYSIILIPIIWLGISQKRVIDTIANLRLRLPLIAVFSILLAATGIGVSCFVSTNSDALYGRGESQNTPLVQPYRQLSTVWPDYSLQFGRDSQGVTGVGSVSLNFLASERGNIAQFDFGYVPRGSFIMSSSLKSGSIQEINVVADQLSLNQQPILTNLGSSYLLTLPFQTRLSGTALLGPEFDPVQADLKLTQIENRLSEYPDLIKTFLLILGMFLIAFYFRRIAADE
jgi:hypothetical protein